MSYLGLVFDFKMSVNERIKGLSFVKTAVFLRNYVIDIKNRLKNEQFWESG